MNKVRAKNVDDEIVRVAVQIIDAWPTTKLTWDFLIEALTDAGLPRYTRQALDRQPQIKSAYTIRVGMLRDQRSQHKKSPALSEEVRDPRVQSLEATVTRLTAENRFFVEKFMRWLYNATAAGMSTDQLDLPLPDIDRNSRPDTDVSVKESKKPRKIQK